MLTLMSPDWPIITLANFNYIFFCKQKDHVNNDFTKYPTIYMIVHYFFKYHVNHVNNVFLILELFSQIISEPCFNILRTKEQLGYIVFSGIRRAAGIQGFRVIVQSHRHPEYLDTRIEALLRHIREYIVEMSDDDFIRNKEALADRRLEKPKKLSTLSSKFWLEILSKQFNFNRDRIEVEELKSVTKEVLLDFFDTHLFHESNLRRKISVHVTSMTEGGAGLESEIDMKCPLEDSIKAPENLMPYKEIVDRICFKSRCGLNPLAEPFVDIETFKKKQ